MRTTLQVICQQTLDGWDREIPHQTIPELAAIVENILQNELRYDLFEIELEPEDWTASEDELKLLVQIEDSVFEQPTI